MDIRHMKGQYNVVADWLSRKDIDLDVAILKATNAEGYAVPIRSLRLNYMRTGNSTNPASISQLQEEYESDPDFTMPFDILLRNRLCPPKMKNILQRYHIWEGLLYYSINSRDQPRLCIRWGSTRSLILQQDDDSRARNYSCSMCSATTDSTTLLSAIRRLSSKQSSFRHTLIGGTSRLTSRQSKTRKQMDSQNAPLTWFANSSVRSVISMTLVASCGSRYLLWLSHTREV